VEKKSIERHSQSLFNSLKISKKQEQTINENY